MFFQVKYTQVFFSDDDLHGPGSQWKVILRKEARPRRKLEEDDNVHISTNVHSVGDLPSSTFVVHPSEPNLTGAIVLNESDNALALQNFDDRHRKNVFRADVGVNGPPLNSKRRRTGGR